MLKYHPSSRVRVAVASVLKWRRPCYPEVIPFMLDDNEVIALTKKLPGTMCTYIGPNNAVTANEENVCEGFVQVNPRDFLAALQRTLSLKNVYAEEIKLSHPCSPYQFVLHSFNINNVNPNYLTFDPSLFPVRDTLNSKSNTERERIHISIIKALGGALSDEVIAVRETAASSLGILIMHLNIK